MPNTVQFHRVLRATPERIYRAFVDAEAMVKWLPPSEYLELVPHERLRCGCGRAEEVRTRISRRTA